MKYVFLLLLTILSLPNHADAVWFSSSWTYKVKVEVVPTKVGTTTAVTNFPVYNDCGGFPSTFWTNASSSGADIRVVESDDATETAFELVTFSTTSKKCELYFKADALATTSTSTFYVYYGNATATAYAVGATYGRNAVWTDYSSVWHMVDGTTDSTGNHTGTTTGTVSFLDANGKFGAGSDTAGTGSDYMSLGTGSNLATGNTNKSISMWFNWDTPSTNRGWLFAGGTGVNDQAYGFFVQSVNGLYFHGNGGLADMTLSSSISANTWYHIAASYEATTTSMNRGYLNGNQVVTNTRTLNTGSSVPRMHLRQNSEVNSRYDGSLDEVRVKEATSTSLATIRTEYNNQSSTSTFFVIGAEQTDTPAPSSTSTPSGAIYFE